MSDTIVIFGASGDLTSRKLIPALFQLFLKGRLPEEARIVGVSRSEFTHQKWRDLLSQSTRQYVGDQFNEAAWSEFANRIFYHPGDITNAESFSTLAKLLTEIETTESSSRIYYLSTMPQLYAEAIKQLGAAGLADDRHGSRRVIIEKPFGTDLKTAQRLNESIHDVFREDQIYRIDHYLGKETVQNIFALRFANSIFEPLLPKRWLSEGEAVITTSPVCCEICFRIIYCSS